MTRISLKPKIIAASSICIAFAISISTAAVAQDIELDFHFLRFGLPHKEVVKMLGDPAAEVISRTLAIKQRRLTWVDDEGQKFVASFIEDRLWSWKKCSARVTEC
jgi:hypothetical protein